MEGSVTGQGRHGSARTMSAVRAAIERSQASITELSREPGINPEKVARWRNLPARSGPARQPGASYRCRRRRFFMIPH
ncbi:transposase [Celeribacter indicus]|uniref:Transposase n=1 Tax=Celeribacter indicus TaxID=1208324 RepID=A0A0B5DZT6_9RHOB|nr:transposase [Celeribacter indicus]